MKVDNISIKGFLLYNYKSVCIELSNCPSSTALQLCIEPLYFAVLHFENATNYNIKKSSSEILATVFKSTKIKQTFKETIAVLIFTR